MNLPAVRKKAEELVEAHGVREAPVPVEDIARSLGLRVVRADLGPDVSGVLVLNGESAYICVQRSESQRRRRFTLGHEVGHFVLRHRFQTGKHVHVDRDNVVMQRGATASSGIDRIEVEANHFSAALLMPEALVRREIAHLRGRPLTERLVAGLAKRFEVSEQAMTIRLSSLGLL